MSFGIYIHIPYCIQRCLYCDFATYEMTPEMRAQQKGLKARTGGGNERSGGSKQLLPPEDYIQVLKKEISDKQNLFSKRPVDTVYFGGGTPSLLSIELIIDVFDHLAKVGFPRGPGCEVTIEINPATVDEAKLQRYLEIGVNRFSVGAQTFNDRLLKMVHREHSADQTIETLELFEKYKLNYNFDLLFALPHQTMEDFRRDLEIVKRFKPPHLSPYCLTVPPHHVLAKSRPLDDVQVEMFDVLHEELSGMGYHQYEISNYAQPGKESRHNLLYWQDQDYWGLGLSSHSYRAVQDAGLKSDSWGYRFWNVKNIDQYAQQIEAQAREIDSPTKLPPDQWEGLSMTEALTDFCHTSLRLMAGLSEKDVQRRFGRPALELVRARLSEPQRRGLVMHDFGHWKLTRQGIYLSNLVFEAVYFDLNDLPLQA